MTSRDEPSCPAGKVWISTEPPVSSRTCLATRSIIVTDGWLVGSTVAQRSVVAARTRTGNAPIAVHASPAPIHSRRVQCIELLMLPPLLSLKSSLDSAPEFARGDARTFGHRRHLRPHNVRIDGRLPDPGAEAAVAPGHDVLATDELRVTPDPLRDELGVLDEVGFRLDHARD